MIGRSDRWGAWPIFVRTKNRFNSVWNLVRNLVRVSEKYRLKILTNGPSVYDIDLKIWKIQNPPIRLSEFQNRLTDFKHPMPILTAVVVKPKESAMRYHEWVEFSPFEIGMAKYATFMKPNHFGSQLGCSRFSATSMLVTMMIPQPTSDKIFTIIKSPTQCCHQHHYCRDWISGVF